MSDKPVFMEPRLRALIAEHGVFTRKEANALGYHDAAIAAHVRSGAWIRVRRGAYVLGPEWSDLGAKQRYATLCRAVVHQGVPGY